MVNGKLTRRSINAPKLGSEPWLWRRPGSSPGASDAPGIQGGPAAIAHAWDGDVSEDVN